MRTKMDSIRILFSVRILHVSHWHVSRLWKLCATWGAAAQLERQLVHSEASLHWFTKEVSTCIGFRNVTILQDIAGAHWCSRSLSFLWSSHVKWISRAHGGKRMALKVWRRRHRGSYQARSHWALCLRASSLRQASFTWARQCVHSVLIREKR